MESHQDASQTPSSHRRWQRPCVDRRFFPFLGSHCASFKAKTGQMQFSNVSTSCQKERLNLATSIYIRIWSLLARVSWRRSEIRPGGCKWRRSGFELTVKMFECLAKGFCDNSPWTLLGHLLAWGTVLPVFCMRFNFLFKAVILNKNWLFKWTVFWWWST